MLDSCGKVLKEEFDNPKAVEVTRRHLHSLFIAGWGCTYDLVRRPACLGHPRIVGRMEIGRGGEGRGGRRTDEDEED